VAKEAYTEMKAAIMKSGFKQKDIANRIGMNASTFYCKINRYNNRDFSFTEAKKIADILNINVSYFFE